MEGRRPCRKIQGEKKGVVTESGFFLGGSNPFPPMRGRSATGRSCLKLETGEGVRKRRKNQIGRGRGGWGMQIILYIWVAAYDRGTESYRRKGSPFAAREKAVPKRKGKVWEMAYKRPPSEVTR